MTGSTRHTAAERREELLAAAIEEFAVAGYQGASTDAIARRAGISQPYLFRLFGSKRDLYLACVRRCFRRTLETFQAAAEGRRGPDALRAIGRAYGELLDQGSSLLRAQTQSYAAAASDPVIAAAVREGYGDLVAYVERVSGADDAALAGLFARGMLLDVLASMGLRASPEPWALRLVAGCREEA